MALHVILQNGFVLNLSGASISPDGVGYTTPAIFNTTIPSAITGSVYSAVMTAKGGKQPYTWAILSGLPPPGISFSTTGIFSGTPTDVGISNLLIQVTDSAGNTGSNTLQLISSAPLAIRTSATLPVATVGTPYSQTLVAAGGTPSYVWSIASGALPAGLTLASAGGVISGTPTVSGTTTPVISVTDSAGNIATLTFTTQVVDALVITSTNPLSTAIVGQAYSNTLAASGGSRPYTWSISAGSLPNGLSLSAQNGSITGTPTTVQTSGVSLTVSDTNGRSTSGSFSLQVLAGVSISTVSPLAGGTVGSTYNLSMAASGGTAPYTWAIISGTLPAGLSFSTAGVFSGTPSAAASVSLTIQVVDAGNIATSGVFTLSIVSNAAAIPNVPTNITAVAGNGSATVSFTPSPTGGVPTSFTATSSDGLHVHAVAATYTSSQIFGLTNGTSYQFYVTANNATGVSAQSALSNAVIPTSLAVSITTLPSGAVGVAYNSALAASGGTSPFVWAISSGTLPSGMSLSTAGVISGTPTSVTTSNLVFSVTDATGAVVLSPTLVLSITATNAIAAYDGTIAVGSGSNSSKLVNGGGTPLLLVGANFSGLEAASAQGYQPWYGNTPNWTTFKTWKPNAVRLPLNAASFLGLSCLTVASSGAAWTSTTARNADPFGNYIAAVDAAIAGAQAAGCYVFLDLHWSAPSFTFSGVSGHAMPLWQPPFMNTTTDLAFWQAIAARYGSQATPQPGINNNGIIFELFNEPYMDQYTSLGATLYGLMKSGGTLSSFKTNSGTTAIAQSWNVLGYQTVLNAIRATGATNVIAIGGPGYSSSMSGYASYMPTDTLSTPQLVQTWHPYQTGSYPYSDGDVWGQCYPDANNGTVNFDTYAKQVIAAGIPVCITEDGGTYGPSATSGEPHVVFMTNWATTHGAASYLQWEAWAPVDPSANGENNLFTSNLTPTVGQGQAFYNWITGLVTTSITVPGAPTGVSATAGNAQAIVSFVAPASNGGATISSYTVIASNGTTVSATSGPITVTGLSNGTAYTFTVKANNSVGSGAASAVSNTITPATTLTSPGIPTSLTLTGQGQNSESISWKAPSTGTAVNHYKIYRNGSSYATSTTTSYVDTAATGANSITYGALLGGGNTDPDPTNQSASTTYTYKVSAVDASANEGPIQGAVSYNVYTGGVFYWAGDYSYGLTVNYADTAGVPQNSAPHDIALTLTSGYGGFQPYSGNNTTLWDLELGAFDHLSIDLKPTLANQTWNLSIASLLYSGSPTPFTTVNVNSYGPAPAVGKWATYNIPLSALSIGITSCTGSIAGPYGTTTFSIDGGSSVTYQTATLTVTKTNSGPGVDAGGFISGTGIPANTYIISCNQNASVGTFVVTGPGITNGTSVSSGAITCQRTNAYKFNLSDSLGTVPNVYYVDNIIFTGSN